MNTYNDPLAVLVEDLINTHDLFLEAPEHLQTPTDLERFLHTHQQPVEYRLTQADLNAVHTLRDKLRTIWNAPETAASQQQLNALLGVTPVMLELNREESETALKFDPDADAAVVDRLSVLCAVGLVGIIQQYGVERMRACLSAPCRDVFIDTSRNRSRRFCSDRCANRYNVAAFRERNRE